MRNPLDKPSVAQSLDGKPSDGEPAFPRSISECTPAETIVKSWRASAKPDLANFAAVPPEDG